MPSLAAVVTGADITARGPQTPALRFYQQYITAIASKDRSSNDVPRFFSKDAVFHNQNGVDYNGDEIWPWIEQIFGQFERLSHDVLRIEETHNDDGTVQLAMQAVRSIWAPGNKSEVPTVRVPVSAISKLSFNNAPGTVGGIQFEEAWLYWDTYKLLPYFSQDAIVFRDKNIFAE